MEELTEVQMSGSGPCFCHLLAGWPLQVPCPPEPPLLHLWMVTPHRAAAGVKCHDRPSNGGVRRGGCRHFLIRPSPKA